MKKKQNLYLQAFYLLYIEIEKLKARRDAARSYPYNNDMMVEAEICQKQIDALRKIYKKFCVKNKNSQYDNNNRQED
jgi:hypothetical protein